jgi:hypothetical protein
LSTLCFTMFASIASEIGDGRGPLSSDQWPNYSWSWILAVFVMTITFALVGALLLLGRPSWLIGTGIPGTRLSDKEDQDRVEAVTAAPLKNANVSVRERTLQVGTIALVTQSRSEDSEESSPSRLSPMDAIGKVKHEVENNSKLDNQASSPTFVQEKRYENHPTLWRVEVQGGDEWKRDSSLKLIPHEKGQSNTATLHVLILAHGYKGAASDLSYLQSQVQEGTTSHLLKTSSSSSSSETQDGTRALEKVVVHAATCNEGKTDDGVRNGGERLFKETYEVIEKEIAYMECMDRESGLTVTKVTLSLEGNSMGGLYARYAAAKVMDAAQEEYQYLTMHQSRTPSNQSFNKTRTKQSTINESSNHHQESMTIFGRQFEFKVFCTTASPHLGVADHTYIKLPRTAEVGVAYAMRDTGRDLFRVTDLLREMATSPYYLNALAAFQKRIAYANAYSTDMLVATATAAFLSSKSTAPNHIFLDTSCHSVQGESNRSSKSSHNEHTQYYMNNPLIVAVLETAKTYKISDRHSKTTPEDHRCDEEVDEDTVLVEDEAYEMARRLDSLGWKKVFIDMRDQMSIELPSLPTFSFWSTSTPSQVGTGTEPTTGSNITTMVGASREKVATVTPSGTRKRSLGRTSFSCTVSSSPGSASITLDNLRSKSKIEVSSKELVEVLVPNISTSSYQSGKISLPLGHNMIVALNRPTSLVQKLLHPVNQKGRPVMDSLAQELVHDILIQHYQRGDGDIINK